MGFGDQGSRIGFLYIDSFLLVCAGNHNLIFQGTICTKDMAQQGDVQNSWIHYILKNWNKDNTIIWRVLVTHHPMWSLSDPVEDFAGINDYLLPILRENKFDLYLNGHEALTSFAYFKNDATIK